MVFVPSSFSQYNSSFATYVDPVLITHDTYMCIEHRAYVD